MSRFGRALKIQVRVLGALVRRDLGSRHGGDAVGNFWTFFEPFLITVIVLAFHWLNGNSGVTGMEKSVSIVALFLTGFVPHLLLRHGGLAGVQALRMNAGLLYHRQIYYMDLIWSRLLGETGFMLITFFVLYFIFYVTGFLQLPESIGYIYLGWFFHIWFVVFMCILFAGLGLIWELSTRLFLPIAYMMIPVYGAFFMMSWVPTDLRDFLLYFPPADATEIIRRGYFGLAQPTYYNIPYTTECLIGLTFIGFMVLDHGRRYLEF
jgi:capsular polysaccharide transport system permease protein